MGCNNNYINTPEKQRKNLYSTELKMIVNLSWVYFASKGHRILFFVI